jgi:GAF domain-containing protein
MNFETIKNDVFEILKTTQETNQKLQTICEVLENEVPHYDWVGFYFANHETKTLHLGPYKGEATDHTIIPFGKGICGQVAVSNQNFIVPDVMAQDNYIACSTTVKSEIVIPIFVNEINIGQIDIDSHKIDAFTKEDEAFLVEICGEIAVLFE